MRHGIPVILAAVVLIGPAPRAAVQSVEGRSSLVLTNGRARLVVDLAGGSIGEFRLRSAEVNPLAWGTPAPGEVAVRGFGHFLCLDRWGPPSKAEGDKGMPYHGEAANVPWSALQESPGQAGRIEAGMTARLPLAGLVIRRRIRLSRNDAAFAVWEEVTNAQALGRLYNAVQHPTIGPPFLDAQTVVDCNGRRGFAQGGALPQPEEPSAYWPRAYTRDGEPVDLRRLTADADPNVVTYAIEDSHGWVTAVSPSRGLLVGYFWKTSDYPWVSLWRDVREGKPAARGLEFGTTGLHQPYPILLRKGRIWDRPLYEYLDAGETTTRGYLAFQLEIPPGFAGVERITLESERLVIQERTRGQARVLSVDVTDLLEP